MTATTTFLLILNFINLALIGYLLYKKPKLARRLNNTKQLPKAENIVARYPLPNLPFPLMPEMSVEQAIRESIGSPILYPMGDPGTINPFESPDPFAGMIPNQKVPACHACLHTIDFPHPSNLPEMNTPCGLCFESATSYAILSYYGIKGYIHSIEAAESRVLEERGMVEPYPQIDRLLQPVAASIELLREWKGN